MARTKFKCQSVLYLCLIATHFVKSLPISRIPTLQTTEDVYDNLKIVEQFEDVESLLTDEANAIHGIKINGTLNATLEVRNNNDIMPLSNIRPGQEVRQYAIEITRNGANFNGRAVIDVRLALESRDIPIQFNVDGTMTIQNVLVGVFTDANAVATPFNVADDILEIFPTQIASSYIVSIEYTAPIRADGFGLFQGRFDESDYIAMNLHPTHARRVFPCMDEPTEASTISFTFRNFEYNTILTNSMLQDDSQEQFRPLQGPVHLWGMVAHNLNNIINPVPNVHLYTRQGVTNQESQAAVALNNYYNALNEWTAKPYTDIIRDQDGRMHVLALPDISRDWYALSTVCIWEPHILMENNNAVKQRKIALVEMAEAMARQWFGYVIYPENWQHQWVITGLSSYAAYDVAKAFQTNPDGSEQILIDMNTVFTTDIIQESLLQDSYTNALPLLPTEALFEENLVRNHVNGLLKYKAPALLRMLRLVLGDADRDFVQSAARALLTSSALQTVSTPNFYDAITSEYSFGGSGLINPVDEFLETWVTNNGYPVINVGMRQGGVIITQERFGFSTKPQVNFLVPLTYTTSVNPDFDNVHPTLVMDSTTTLNFVLEEEDWVLCNIQGQGYYRVNYDAELWMRISGALFDPERREVIHPLNRATLVDDALNLARAGSVDYSVAFEIVLSMEHETEYPVWKAFVRNMEFIRKRLMAMLDEDEELDPDIYLRMIRRTITAVEEELGFKPDNALTEPAMRTLTRGLVMDHACRAGYQPCIAAAVDWFYDPVNNDVVNPNIPPEIRPAVYCAMVSEGDEDEIAALYSRMEIEPSRYERLVILESLACSRDENFIQTYLEETIAANGPYLTEERGKIFAAVASSSLQNARLALNFMTRRTNEIRNMYGGPEKLEEAIFALADNMAGFALSTDFTVWVNSLDVISNLGDSDLAALRARDQIADNMNWDNELRQIVYEWIDENDASTVFLSSLLICLSLIVTLFNNF